MLEGYFFQDDRLGIPVPLLDKEWDDYNEDTRESILFQWEGIRGKIPDRIAELELRINLLQAELTEENDFLRSCELNNEIAELASVINDLWLWYRASEDINTDKMDLN